MRSITRISAIVVPILTFLVVSGCQANPTSTTASQSNPSKAGAIDLKRLLNQPVSEWTAVFGEPWIPESDRGQPWATGVSKWKDGITVVNYINKNRKINVAFSAEGNPTCVLIVCPIEKDSLASILKSFGLNEIGRPVKHGESIPLWPDLKDWKGYGHGMDDGGGVHDAFNLFLEHKNNKGPFKLPKPKGN